MTDETVDVNPLQFVSLNVICLVRGGECGIVGIWTCQDSLPNSKRDSMRLVSANSRTLSTSSPTPSEPRSHCRRGSPDPMVPSPSCCVGVASLPERSSTRRGRGFCEGGVRAGVGVGHVLRELGARGVGVVIESDAGDHRGVIDAVFSDHVDLILDGGSLSDDGRDDHREVVISLALAGLRRLRVLGQRWSCD